MPKFTNHAEMVKILSKPGEDIIRNLTPLKAHLFHMASCVQGEVAELYDAVNSLDTKNAIEEIGDIDFYLEGIRQGLNITRDETLENGLSELGVEELVIKAGWLFDAIKKNVIYSKEIDIKTVVNTLTGIEACLAGIRLSIGISREETIQVNLDKLNKRYPDGYSDKAAQARADKVA